MTLKTLAVALLTAAGMLAGSPAAAQSPDPTPMAELRTAMEREIRLAHGDPYWPTSMKRPTTTEALEAHIAERRSASFVGIAGALRGPDGVLGEFRTAIPDRVETRVNLPNGGPVILGVRSRDGLFDVAGAAHGGGVPRVGSREGAPDGTPFDLSLGDGYVLSLTLGLREPDERERLTNERLAGLAVRGGLPSTTGPTSADGVANPPPPIIMQSPLTNSVIRQGEVR